MPSDGVLDTKETLNHKVQTLDTPLTNGSQVTPEMELTAVDGLADVASFRELADMLFMPSQVLQPHERAYLIDMIKVALPALVKQERLHFAQRVAQMGGGSAKPLLPILSRDEDLEIASAILSSTITLADDALVELVHSAEPERLMLIAQRPDLSTAVTAAIFYTENTSAICQSLKNPKARFSPQILAECVALARDHTVLGSPLMQRPEVTPAVALDLFWVQGHKGRTDILYRHLADDQYLNKTSLSTSSAAMRQRNNQAKQTIAAGADDLEQLNAFISVGEIEKAIPLLVRAAGLRDVLAQQILSDPGGEPLTVLYKHAGARRAQFQELCQRTKHLGLSPLAENADFEGLAVLFDKLSRGQAHMAITYWDWRAAGIGPYATQTEEPVSMQSLREKLASNTAQSAPHIQEVVSENPVDEKPTKAGFGKRTQPVDQPEPPIALHAEPVAAHAEIQENMPEQIVEPQAKPVRDEEEAVDQRNNVRHSQQVVDQVVKQIKAGLKDDLKRQIDKEVPARDQAVRHSQEIVDQVVKQLKAGLKDDLTRHIQSVSKEEKPEFREKLDELERQTEDDEVEFIEKLEELDLLGEDDELAFIEKMNAAENALKDDEVEFSEIKQETEIETKAEKEPVLDMRGLPRLGKKTGYLSDID